MMPGGPDSGFLTQFCLEIPYFTAISDQRRFRHNGFAGLFDDEPIVADAEFTF